MAQNDSPLTLITKSQDITLLHAHLIIIQGMQAKGYRLAVPKYKPHDIVKFLSMAAFNKVLALCPVCNTKKSAKIKRYHVGAWGYMCAMGVGREGGGQG